jgi:sugar phosphate isomerase/epimerase
MRARRNDNPYYGNRGVEMVDISDIPFRIGTTSFIYRADIITNVKKLKDYVDDIEIVLFESKENDGLPDLSVLEEIRHIVGRSDTSVTVHLPLDLRLGDTDPDCRIASVDCAVKIIDRTSIINPWAYIVHLNPGMLLETDSQSLWDSWASFCRESLSEIASRTKNSRRICIENLENYRHDRLDSVIEGNPISLCLDIGHLWVQQLDPVPIIEKYGTRIRVVHIHGIRKRDHASLKYVEKSELKRVLDALHAIRFPGVLTIEIFNRRDLKTSLKKIGECAIPGNKGKKIRYEG